MPIQTWRKKPVEVEVILFDGKNQEEISDWLLHYGAAVRGFKTHINIVTLEGTMRADPGDVIIKGVNNEFYPCKPGIFWKTYEKVEKAE